jgi:DNA-binding PadR family transcriptional regulator
VSVITVHKNQSSKNNALDITKQILDSQLLFLIRLRPQTLYSIKKALAEHFDDDRSFGTIHPHLLKLEDAGLIRSRKGEDSSLRTAKIVYYITRKGRSVLTKDVAELTQLALKLST